MKVLRSAALVAVPALASSAFGQATQWDFNSPATPLVSSFGPGIMTFWDRITPGITEADTQFGTTTFFGIADIAGVPANVMKVPPYFGDEGLLVEHNTPGHGGLLGYGNAYTLVFDVYVTTAASMVSGWLPFHNTNATNSNDADFYVAFSDLSIGIGQLGYSPAGSFTLDAWNRIAVVYNLDIPTTPRHWIYVNGIEVFNAAAEGEVDNRFPIYTHCDADPPDTFHLFTEPDGLYTTEAYYNSVYFEDRALSAAEIAAMGAPDADGIAPTVPCPADWNHDTIVNSQDFFDFLASFFTVGGSADFNADCATNSQDFFDFLAAFFTPC